MSKQLIDFNTGHDKTDLDRKVLVHVKMAMAHAPSSYVHVKTVHDTKVLIKMVHANLLCMSKWRVRKRFTTFQNAA